MESWMSAIVIIDIVLHGILLLYAQARRSYLHTSRRWLFAVLLLSLLTSLTYFLPENLALAGITGRGLALILALAGTLTAFGALVIRDVNNRSPRLWLVAGIIWLIAIAATAFISNPANIGQPEWLINIFTTPDLFGIATLGGLLLMSIVLVGIAFYGFYAATLPEVANRALFWVMNSALLLLGIVLSLSGTTPMIVLGLVALLGSAAGAVYAQVSYRIFDIRLALSSALRTLLLVLLTALVTFGVAYAVLGMQIRLDDQGQLAIAALSLIVAVIFVPLFQLVGTTLNRLTGDPAANSAQATRQYSQQVSKAVEIEQLVRVGSETLNKVLRVRRSGLILVNDTDRPDGKVELIVMRGEGFSDTKETKGYVNKTGPVYKRLAGEQSPLGQFDIEFSPQFKTIQTEERDFFQSMQMSAYAPIIVDNALIGVLACGSKNNDSPLYQRDLDMLATMADQTGVALRNARLVADLRHLNDSMKSLNEELEESNDQLAKLDSVKTDFITIASHELRTPLAQIRGYTDIIDALNEQGMLDRDQIAGMVANLRKAAERTEELIAAMLDVSQLDVNAMDLRFTQAAPESVIRMAIEPLTDAIKQRKLTLSARGLRGLPTIHADMQRLVQAFRNIVVNGIKFTPDGGRIEINAATRPGEAPDGEDAILISISDTGVGIDKDNLDLIFEKFYRAYDPGLHSTGTYKFLGAGPGLGLTIAKGVIEGHGGKIWAESPGHNMDTNPGTTFYVLLPVNPPREARRVMPFEDHGTAAPSDPTIMRPQAQIPQMQSGTGGA
jgi:signal transduction histidine kinase